MGKNKNKKPRGSSGSKVAQLADSASTSRSSSETIRPFGRHTPTESENWQITASSSEPSTGPTSEGAETSEPVSHIENASKDMNTLDRQTTEDTNKGLVPVSGGEQSEDIDNQDTSLTYLPDSIDATAPGDADAGPHSPLTEHQPDILAAAGDEKQAYESEPSAMIPSQPDEDIVKSAEEDSNAGFWIPWGKTQSETGVATDGRSQSNNDDILAMMLRDTENGRDGGQVNDSDSKYRSMDRGNDEFDAAEREDHSEENKGQGDSARKQIQLPVVQEPLDSERREAQELQSELGDVSQDRMRLETGASQQGLPSTGPELQGLRERRPSANNLSVAVDSHFSPVTVVEARPRTVRGVLLLKGQFLEEDSRTSRAIASVVNYIDGVGDEPSRQDMAVLEEYRAYTVERIRVLEQILDGGEPIDALERFDQRWQQKSTEEAWGDRQELHFAAVRAAMHFRQYDGSAQGELAEMLFEHKVAEVRKKLGGDDFDDPVALQTLDIMRAVRG